MIIYLEYRLDKQNQDAEINQLNEKQKTLTTVVATLKPKISQEKTRKDTGRFSYTPDQPINDTGNPVSSVFAFRGKDSPLSNFYHVKNKIHAFDDSFDCAEKAYQCIKADFHYQGDDMYSLIKNARHPVRAKHLGEEFVPNEEWLKVREDYMYQILKAKYESCPEFRDVIINNPNAIFAEASEDMYWGTGLNVQETLITSPEKWKGQNRLGIMMEELQREIFSRSTDQLDHSDSYITNEAEHRNGLSEETSSYNASQTNVTSKVLIIGDSNTRSLNSDKFSNKINTTIISNAFTCEDAAKHVAALKENSYDAVLLHLGTNHAKNREESTITCVQKLSNMIEETLLSFPQSKLLISQLPPSQHSKVDGKITDINALIIKKYESNSRITFIKKSKLWKRQGQQYIFLQDNYHLSEDGVKILASSMKRAIKDVL